ncbi:hypothetical protein Godav_019362 [Gossypium davidsonii]|uniref:RNase H type-1 domain-containing protein n=2 Tax=Gossypium TaxID=3633 RepID=A0A7J8QZJ5_GOSDV|nr:hypothetical protein [Gossypium davidsonii]MBA0641947.1 hypothetical protein [Gossypium klotzschianum]
MSLFWGDNWVRLQMDGAVKIDSGYAPTREDLRDERGEWLFGFNKLKQCERVLIQTDSLEVVEAIQDPNSKSSCSALVRRIRQLLDSIRNWRLDYIPREENKETDQMAKMTFDTEDRLQLFAENPLVSFV